MPELRISKEVHTRIKEFKQIIEAVVGEEMDIDKCAELILGQGIDAMLADIVGSVDDATLLKSFQQLGSQFPSQVYRYVAEALRKGIASQAIESLARQIGFTPSQGSETVGNELPE
jgi:hypothetical protein